MLHRSRKVSTTQTLLFCVIVMISTYNCFIYLFQFSNIMKTAITTRQPSLDLCKGNARRVLILIIVLLAIFLLWTPFRQSLSRPLHNGISSSKVNILKVNLPKRDCVWIEGSCQRNVTETFAIKGLTIDRYQFYFDGSPFRIISGSFHYFRVHPTQWADRLLKMKAGGFNTVSTYIPWNLHEQVKGQYDFSGLWNLAAFIEQVHTVGLKLIVRPGPYICAEWEYGGFPSWLLSDPKMVVRTSKYPRFLAFVSDYFDQLLPLLAEYQYKTNKGPIIAFQVENEYGTHAHYVEYDRKYLEFIKKQFDKWGIVEILFTSDGSFGLRNGSIPGVLASVNIMDEPYSSLLDLKEFQMDAPLFVGEVYCGWYDRWQEQYHKNTGLKQCAKLIMEILYTNASLNLYMFVGGTNFGFWNGANNGSAEDYYPITTSYDYDAPISETGDLSPKFFMLKAILQLMGLGPKDWPSVPDNPIRLSYGEIRMTEYIEFGDIIETINNVQYSTNITTMERLDIHNGSGQGYGWILYRKVFVNSSQLIIYGKVEDRAQLFLNNKMVALLQWNQWKSPVKIDLRGESNVVDILVENTGRVNFKHNLNHQLKGINGYIEVDGEISTGWLHVPLEFDVVMYEEMSMSNQWKPFSRRFVPTAYRGNLRINSNNIEDTFLDMTPWTKGVVLINGFNIGRYWYAGPQRTLYVPGGLLHSGDNDVVVFDLHGGHATIVSVDTHKLGDVQPTKDKYTTAGRNSEKPLNLEHLYTTIKGEWDDILWKLNNNY